MFAGLQTFCLLAAIWCLGDNTNSFAAEPEVFAGAHAEYFFRTQYQGLGKHKAIAVGPWEMYGYSYGYRSGKEAAKFALIACQNVVAQFAKRQKVSPPAASKCKLLAQDGKLQLENPWVGPAMYTPVTGPDLPLENGIAMPYRGLPVRGIVLYLHGCNGNRDPYYPQILGDFFNAAGFSLYAPNSYAEVRPPDTCGNIPLSRHHDRTIIRKLRISQTERSIEELRRRFPNLPIYAWGQSEGAATLKFINKPLAGLILTGDECDVDGARIAAPANVPVLFMVGENDPFLEGSKVPHSEKQLARCRKFIRSKKLTIKVIRNAGHDIFPWRPEVAKTVLNFFKADQQKVESPKPESSHFRLSPRQHSAFASYQSGVKNKAFAFGRDDIAWWVSRLEYEQDAAHAALYGCAKQTNVNYFAQGIAACRLFDVNGKSQAAP